jgi:thiol-disulfide isomerase/thioredoxin
MKYLITFIILITGLFTGCAREPQPELPFNYDEKNFTLALRSGTPVVLEIGANWCKQCIEQQPIMEELEGEYKEVKFFLANFDTEKELVKKYRVRGIPYFVFFDAGGKKSFEITGFQEKKVMEMFIKRVLYGSFVQNDTYTTFGGLKEPEIKLKDDKVIIETQATENLTVWGESVEIILNNMTLEVLNVTPPINSIRDFEVMNLTEGAVIKAEAGLPINITAYDTLNVELKLGIFDIDCCGNYREVLVGGSFIEFD